jgi:ribosomal protein S12 methylthiotransferase accessory factor
VIRTDQSTAHGGRGAGPEPYDLFLASIGTCAGAYVLGFCDARGISTADIVIVQRHFFDKGSGRLERVTLEITLPATFPEKYRAPLIRAIEGCKVKRTLASAPEIAIVASQARLEAEPFGGLPNDAPAERRLEGQEGDVCDEPV